MQLPGCVDGRLYWRHLRAILLWCKIEGAQQVLGQVIIEDITQQKWRRQEGEEEI